MFLLDAFLDSLGPTCRPAAERKKIGITIASLVACVALGLFIALSGVAGSRWPLPVYVAFLALFHLLEYTWSWRFEGNEVSFDSFLLNKNWPQYHLAILAAFLEYGLETFVWPEGKFISSAFASSVIAPFGLSLCILGLTVRVVGMWHCGNNFSHEIETQARADHVLVSDGIYRFLRHPAYTGWAYWSVGTQVLLCNPVGILAYYWVVRQFFISRIRFEERTLVQFFGKSYVDYARRTYLLIPGVPANIGALGMADGGPGGAQRRPQMTRENSKAD